MERHTNPKGRAERSHPPTGKQVRRAKPPGYEVVLKRAEEVVGDNATAVRWLGRPVRELDDRTPVAVLEEGPNGLDAVLAVLTKIEHGVL